jgi:methionyl aminopeptidase
MEIEVLEKYQKAIKIGDDVVKYAKAMKLENQKIIDIVLEIENVIKHFGGKPAWPVNILINEIAAHYTPDINNPIILKEGDLVKIDVGVQIDGYISDRAFSVCIGQKTHPLIEASEKGLEEAIKLIKPGTKIYEISEVVENTVESFGFNTIKNLCGHAVERYNQHAPPSIPNGKNTIKDEIEVGQVIAMEVFSTNGDGWVVDSSPTSIFKFKQDKTVRLFEARKILEMARDKFECLPFTKRWIEGISSLKFDMGINQLLEADALFDYPPLKDKGNGLVAVTEDTIIVK